MEGQRYLAKSATAAEGLPQPQGFFFDINSLLYKKINYKYFTTEVLLNVNPFFIFNLFHFGYVVIYSLVFGCT